MANPIKYNVSAETLALKKGNFWFGTGDVAKGPTSATGYYAGITPPSSGYTIYLNKASNGPSILTASNDSELISQTNLIAGASYTSATECLTYFATQTDKMVFNADYPNIVTSGLVLNLDAGFVSSYPRSGTTWSDLSELNNSGSLINGPTFSGANAGSIVFDGTNDYFATNGVSIPSNSSVTFSAFLKINNWGSGANPGIWRSDSDSKGTYFFIFNTTTGRPWVRWNGSNILQPSVGYQTPLNEWIYITFVVKSATEVLYYVNGDLKHNAIHAVTTSSFTIFNFNYQFSLAEGLGANYSNIQLYTRDLSSTEITQNYNALKGRYGL